MEGVKEVPPHRLALQAGQPRLQARGTVVKIGDVEIGGSEVVVMAGPCSIESREQIERCCRHRRATAAPR